MQKIIQNLPKVFRGHIPSSSNISTSLPTAPLQSTSSTDNTKENNLPLCARPPGHLRVFSWLPGGNCQRFSDNFHFILEKYEREFEQRNRWQSDQEGGGSASQAFGWGTVVVVAIQLCRTLSAARFPDSDSHPGIRSPLLTAAQLLPIPRFSHRTARNILSDSEGDRDSDEDSVTSFSVSLDESSCDSETQTTTSVSEDEPEKQTTAKTRHSTESPAEDGVIPALKLALSHLEEAHQRTQGMVETMIGVHYARIGNYSKAVEHFQAGCELGYSKAQFNLGLCFELGKGVKSDMSKAAELYQQAAQQGHPLALYNLGVYCCHGFGGKPQDEKEGVTLMERAAAGGVVLADSFLGLYYLQARNRNISKAVFYLKRAAEEEDPESQYLLGLCYEQGWGVHKNRKKAARLYHKSAEKGYALAVYSMGLYYEKGLGGVIKNIEQAKKLYTAASKDGLELATERLEALSKLEAQTKPEVGSGDADESANLVLGSKLPSHQENNTLHTSNSEPVLQSNVNAVKTAEENNNLPKLSYLSLILPSLLKTRKVRIGKSSSDITENGNESRVTFQVGDGDGDDITSTAWKREPWETLELVV